MGRGFLDEDGFERRQAAAIADMLTSDDPGVDVATLAVEALIELCEEGNQAACEELDRRGVEPPVLEPDPVVDTDAATQRLCLTMGPRHRTDLRIRASVLVSRAGARDLLEALAHAEIAGPSRFRVRCSGRALAFMRDEAPDIARCWPAVFGELEQPRSLTLAMIAHRATGKAIAGVEIDRDGALTIRLNTGDVIVARGQVDWMDRQQVERAAATDDPRGEADR